MESIKNKVRYELERVEALKKAWENVEFVSKKDGKPFKTLSHNIKNAKLECQIGGISNVDNILKVYTSTIKGSYVNDSIYCYSYFEYADKEKIEMKPQNIVKTKYADCYVDYYVFDIDDIKEAIKDRITYLENELDNLKKQLDNFEIAYANFKEGYLKLLENLKKDTFSTSKYGNFAYNEISNQIIKYYH